MYSYNNTQLFANYFIYSVNMKGENMDTYTQFPLNLRIPKTKHIDGYSNRSRSFTVIDYEEKRKSIH